MHNIVIPSLYVLSGLSIYATLNHLIVGLRRPFSLIHFIFAGITILILPLSFSEIAMLQATSVTKLILALKLNIAALLLFFILFPWFISLYTKNRPHSLLLCLNVLFALLFLVNLSQPFSLQYNSLTGLQVLHMPWGEQLTKAVGFINIWFYFTVAGAVACFGYAFYALISLYRRSRHMPLGMLSSVGLLLLGTISGVLTRTLLIDFVEVGSFTFVAIIITMSVLLNRETQQSLRASEKRFRELIDKAPDAILLYNIDLGRFVDANDSAEKLFGCTRDELLRSSPEKFYPPLQPDQKDISESFTEYKSRALAGEQVQFERLIHAEDGRDIVCEVRLVGFPSETDRLIRASLIDITERKRAEKAVRESEERFRRFFDGAVDGVFVYDQYGRFVDVNEMACNSLGYTRDELLRLSVSDVEVGLKFADLTGFREQIRSGQSTTVEGVHRRRDGSTFPVEVHVALFSFNEQTLFFAAVRDITDRKKTEEAVLKLSMAVQQSPVSIVITDIQGNIEFVNSEFTKMTGYERKEALGQNPRILKTNLTPPEEYERLWATISSGNVWSGEFPNKKKNGELFWEFATISPIMNSAGVITNYLAIEEDITNRKNLEAQLLQAQKLEAVGCLAGGIAHDFNNMLTAIFGYGGLLKNKLEKDLPLKAMVDQILSAAEKSSNLTRQLLAFSRKQIIEPKETDLHELIRGIEKLLLRLIGEDIEFNVQLADKALTVMVDPGQIEQVLMNLCNNARDAMPNGGLLAITTGTIELDEDYVKTHDMKKPGLYACISVTDSGEGIHAKNINKIFEPFFTTKELGKGTGLGLSIVYGIIKQHGGDITAYSEPGKGTTFRIYLPMIISHADEAKVPELVAPKGGTETILIAEDREDVRAMMRQVLEVAGYGIIEAIDGDDAVEKFREHRSNIQLVMVDVIMPKKNGKEVSDEILKIKNDARILFCSGYTEDIISRQGITGDGMDFISKPVTPDSLLRKIRELLDKGK